MMGVYVNFCSYVLFLDYFDGGRVCCRCNILCWLGYIDGFFCLCYIYLLFYLIEI